MMRMSVFPLRIINLPRILPNSRTPDSRPAPQTSVTVSRLGREIA